MVVFVATEEFQGDLVSLDSTAQKLVKQKLSFLSQLINPLTAAKKIRGYRDIYRFRAGDYRIISRLSGRYMILLTVGHRKDIYHGI